MASIANRIFADKIKEAEFVQPPEYHGKKLIVKAWSGDLDNPSVLQRRTIKYGQPSVTMRIAGKDRLYKINYLDKGLIKQDGKNLVYDTHFLNTVGGMRFHEYPEDIDSEEAYTVFKNNGVDMYVKKGGISQRIFLLLLAMVSIGMVVSAVLAIYTINAQAQSAVDAKNLISLSGKISALEAQVQNMGGKPVY
jgi:hypothetical protein